MNSPWSNSVIRVKKKNKPSEPDILILPAEASAKEGLSPEVSTKEDPAQQSGTQSPSSDKALSDQPEPPSAEDSTEVPDNRPAKPNAEERASVTPPPLPDARDPEPLSAEDSSDANGFGQRLSVEADSTPSPEETGEEIPKFEPKSEYKNTSGSATSTPSIKNALSGLKKKEEESMPDGRGTSEAMSSEEGALEDAPLSREELMKFWDTYIDTLQEQSARMYLALSSQEPEIGEDNSTISIAFRNNAQMTEFKQNFKIPLQAYLKENLNCHKLEIRETVLDIDEKSQSKYYTDLDKLKFMIEKNSTLKKLRKDFNLDFE